MVAPRARNEHGTIEYIVDAEADLAAIVNPQVSAFALAMSEKTIWVFTGSIWEQIGAGGVTDHGGLTGLADDDHTQYATNVEFDDHNARHEPGGGDPMTVDAAAATGSLRTLGTGAAQAAAGNHTHGGGSGVDVEEDNVAVGTATVIDFGTGLDVAFAAGEADVTVDLSEVTAFTDHSARHESGGADVISVAGLAGIPTELQTHLDDAADAHDASAISVLDTAAQITATDVEGALAEIVDAAQAHEAAGDPHTGYRLETADHTHATTGLQAGQLDHGTALTGLTDDDHTQYRLESADHTHQSTGAQAGTLDHGLALTGLTDDDHTQYLLKTSVDAVAFSVGVFFDGNGSTLTTGVRPIWRAPFACTVTQVRGYVDTGTTTVINACKDATGTNNFCSADITIDPADAWEAGTVNQNQSVAAGDTVGVEIVTAGTATQLTIQIEFTRDLSP